MKVGIFRIYSKGEDRVITDYRNGWLLKQSDIENQYTVKSNYSRDEFMKLSQTAFESPETLSFEKKSDGSLHLKWLIVNSGLSIILGGCDLTPWDGIFSFFDNLFISAIENEKLIISQRNEIKKLESEVNSVRELFQLQAKQHFDFNQTIFKRFKDVLNSKKKKILHLIKNDANQTLMDENEDNVEEEEPRKSSSKAAKISGKSRKKAKTIDDDL